MVNNVKSWFLLSFLALSVALPNTGETQFLVPGDNMTLDGIPPIPASIADDAGRYGQYRSASFAEWHPDRLEMLVRTRFGNTTQVHKVAAPGAFREQLTFFHEPVGGLYSFAANGPNGDFFTYSRDVGGGEFFQLYRHDVATGRSTLLTDGTKRHGGGVMSRHSGLLAYSRWDADEEGAFTQIRIVDPKQPRSDRIVITLRGGGWTAKDWSPDDEQLLLIERLSINDGRVWLMDTDSGQVRQLLPAVDDGPVANRGAIFSKDGMGFYVTSDASSEFLQLKYVDLETLQPTVLSEGIDWDIDSFDVSADGDWIAFKTNEAGLGGLYLHEISAKTTTPVEGLPVGVIGGLRWHNDNQHLAVSLGSSRVPGDVFVLDAVSGDLVRWTLSETGGLDTTQFSEPELIKWQSFDGREISAFYYKPPDSFEGRRPVVVNIHGGPEGQSRPRYLGRWNYFLNELGAAIIYPNVRGSAGFGKTFLMLDNGMQREDTYKDIGSLLDWIAKRDDLDAERIMIRGGSYGGHMTLAVATRYNDRIACSINRYGLSNLRTFLENTQGYRRDLRRVEYGDERVPEIREWMDRTAPMALVRNIRKPMLVQQGVNDPRVPKSESDQIVSSLKEIGTPTWYLVFDDEGHGFRKKSNADFAFYTVIMFGKECLLN
jgi:dipeptidyl aminopeptidase/acylaminoacyl peptidase